jgi:uncharacterized radical SAM superfamily Fe-S cluster-containing enzyme
MFNFLGEVLILSQKKDTSDLKYDLVNVKRIDIEYQFNDPNPEELSEFNSV